MGEYDVPETIKQMFDDVLKSENGVEYSIVDYSDEMDLDNVESMAYFLDMLGVDSEDVLEDNGTLVYLKDVGYAEVIAIESYGLGDTYSHGFYCSVVKEDF